LIAARLVVLATIVAGPSDPEPTWQGLERASPAELARLIPGAQAAAGTWVEKRTTRIPGVAQWRGINVELAAAPRPTGWSGLCAFDTASGYFVPPRGDGGDRLTLNAHERALRYRLAARISTLAREPVDAPTVCEGTTLTADGAKDLSVTAEKSPATLAQAAFAIRAVAAALRRSARCTGEDRSLCRGIALRSLDLAQMHRLDLSPCGDGGRRWCVRGQWDRPRGDGPVFVDADTATSLDVDLDAANPRAGAVKLATYIWPLM